MTESFVIKTTSTVEYNGISYTVSGIVEPVFTDEFPEELVAVYERMRKAQSELWGALE